MGKPTAMRHRCGLAAALAAVAVLASSGATSAITPCPPLSYSVSFASPFCNATLLSHTGPVPLVNVWWPNWWNGTPSPANGTGFERASDHVGQVADSDERVTVQDRDGNLNLTAGDVLETWSPGGCGGDLILYLGRNVTAQSGVQYLHMEAGYEWICGGSPPDYLTPALLIAVLVVAFAIPLAVVALRWRRMPRQ